jgi:lipopolysaccharide transport system permease protein
MFNPENKAFRRHGSKYRMKDKIELVIEPQRSFALNIGELWQYRELFYFFTWRDVKVKYKQTVLGILWVILQPLLMMLISTFIVRRALGITLKEMDYTLFVLSGLILWNFFSASVNHAGTSMLTNAAIIKKIYFPRLIIPCAGILVSLVDFFVSLGVFLIFLIIKSPPINFLNLLICWPFALILAIIGTLGIVSWLSALSVKYRDFRFIVPFIIQFGFFVTPVLYPISIQDKTWINYVLAINPMYGAITLFRLPFMQTLPDFNLIGISLLSALMLTVIGLYYFKKTESFFADLA